MKRLLGVGLVAAGIVAVGCSKYEKRLDSTLERMKYQQRLDQYLKPAEAGPFRDLGIHLRVPKGMNAAKEVQVVPEEGAFDLVANFADPAAGGGGAQAKEGAPPPQPLRLNVLARVKRKKAPPKKGETPPPEVPRGEFKADVRALLAASLGNPEDAQNKADAAERKRNNEYRRLIFTAGNGNVVRAYLYKIAEYDVALIWNIPPAAERAAATPIDLSLETLAVGPRALNLFQGGSDDEPPAAGTAPGAGTAF
jgi:hypothetical protein